MAFAVAAGRLPRYVLLAWLGVVLNIPTWVFVGLCLLFLTPAPGTPASLSATTTPSRMDVVTRSFVGSVALLLVAAACGSGSVGGDAVTRRDSAGIQIVESAAAVWAAGEEWQIAPQPLLEIGVTEGDSAYLLYFVTAVQRLTDGRIVVANAGTDEVRFYDSSGVFLDAVGRSGRGPGEFRSIGRLDVREDSLYISDYGNARISILAPDGAHVRSVNLSSVGLSIPRTVGLFGDGSMLLWADAAADLEFVEGVNTSYTIYHRLTPDGTAADSLGRFFSGEHFVTGRDGGGYSSAGMPFGVRASAVVAGETFFHTDGRDVSIVQYTMDGSPSRIVRHAHEAAGVTGADRDSVVEAYLSRFPEDRRPAARRRYRDMPLPATKPSVASLLVGADGDLWVGQYTSGFAFYPRCWWVFAAAGELLGSVCLPEGFALHQVGADFVLGISTDELDTERVVMYELVK